MNQAKITDIAFDNREYLEFSQFLCDVCGIELGDNKQYLVSTRVRRVLLDSGCSSLTELTRRINKGGDNTLRQQVIDVMTTNETFWFRDSYPFEYLEKAILPNIEGRSALRIWSAACSSGQEPYSISMIIEEAIKKSTTKKVCAEIVATDLSSRVLTAAKKAHYDKLAIIRGLSSERAKIHFSQVDSDRWVINNEIKSRVSFRPLNLQESFFILGKFDVVFCRNVLIYFSAGLKRDILRRVHATLAPGGILFLGSSESVSGLDDCYDMIHCNPGIAYRAKPL